MAGWLSITTRRSRAETAGSPSTQVSHADACSFIFLRVRFRDRVAKALKPPARLWRQRMKNVTAASTSRSVMGCCRYSAFAHSTWENGVASIRRWKAAKVSSRCKTCQKLVNSRLMSLTTSLTPCS